MPDVTAAGARLFAENIAILENIGITVILTGVEPGSDVLKSLYAHIDKAQKVRQFAMLDDAIEWAEDQVIYRYGGFTNTTETTHLSEQALLSDLTASEIATLIEFSTTRHYQAGAENHRLRRTGQLDLFHSARPWSASSCRAACVLRRSGPAWNSARWR